MNVNSNSSSQYYYHLVRQNDMLIKEIEKSINGEYSAIQCYGKIANLAPTERAKKQILEIRQDEIRHYQLFTQLYTHLTGKTPAPKISEECPEKYKEGLEFAFIDEQETVDFYLTISDKATDPYTRDLYRRAAADEQNHAVWFLYYLNK